MDTLKYGPYLFLRHIWIQLLILALMFKDIKRLTRRKFTAEEKIHIVLEGFRRDTPIRDLCHREGIHPGTYYAWLKDFTEAGKDRLTRDTVRDAFA